MSDLTKTILNTIEEFVNRIIRKHPSLKKEELMLLWSNTTTSSTEVRKVSTTSNSGCPYVFTKGKRSGERCGKATCSLHEKKANQPPKEKKILPLPKRSTDTTSSVKSNASQIKLRSHTQLKVLYHPQTGIVFSFEGQEATSKIVDDKIVPLTEKDLEICQKYRFVVQKEVLERLAKEEKEDELEDEPGELKEEEDEDDKKMEAVKRAFGVESSDEEEVEI